MPRGPTGARFPSASITCCSPIRSMRSTCPMADNVLAARPEFVRDVAPSAFGVVQKPLTAWEKLYGNAAVRKGVLLALLAVLWEVYGTILDNPLLFPRFSDTFAAFYSGIASGVLLTRAWFS